MLSIHMRRVAEEQRDTREHIRESARDDERQTAGTGIQLLLQRMDRFEKHLSRLASRLHGIEELCKSMQELCPRVMTEQAKGRGSGIKSYLCEESGNGTYALMRRHSNYGFRLSYPHLALL